MKSLHLKISNKKDTNFTENNKSILRGRKIVSASCDEYTYDISAPIKIITYKNKTRCKNIDYLIFHWPNSGRINEN